jgi:serine/threonine protein kinase
VYTSFVFDNSWTVTQSNTTDMAQDPLQGISVQNLSPLYESFFEEDDEHGIPVFESSSFGYITENFLAYFGESNLRKHDLTPTAIKESLKLLPDDDVYPKVPPGVTTVSPPIHSKLFVKHPKLNTSFKGTGLLPKLILEELEVLERLKKRPHPHIVRYFDHCSRTLHQTLEEDGRSIDTKICMDSITAATEHLHALGLAHNDLNPHNIMIDEKDVTYVIDMGSCQPSGHDLITGGSIGWVDEEFTTSHPKHDDAALKKLRTWLERYAKR